MAVGLMGASSFKMDISSDILPILSATDQNKMLIMIVNTLFPVAVLVTSIPVFAIVIRYNLVRGNICSNSKRHTFDISHMGSWRVIRMGNFVGKHHAMGPDSPFPDKGMQIKRSGLVNSMHDINALGAPS
jgi:hypothetical protein